MRSALWSLFADCFKVVGFSNNRAFDLCAELQLLESYPYR